MFAPLIGSALGNPRRRNVVLLLAVIAAGGALLAQEPTAVRTLKGRFDAKYQNEVVTVRGHVQAENIVSSQTFKAFFLKDRYGDLILIRTTRDLPAILS